ncbi:hypothetical protein LSEI_2140 [Lacticaseibacillus paracasei ATCC 334]|uniref:Uncharacterized protein n=1 Tax=Lacticaseibacillus paracasei (strain ATCC 334 / BCRC 17002 / CCUG 31169 / CIP 107868 / KCTC 3260 / NRRL B-441) TaxID=321967 RepID=Q036I2_LACP3|nr:hypothetical protein LSEI_2140 [Lacticaseibacillus paracasei ATCC 334]KAB1967306.1 hypothetical protein F8272_05030 [Lacticaseibacillus paracasei]MCT3331764.1 hypothetical protein [Lacticaseibacillus paracasei]
MSELATRRFGVATAKLEWWARLRAHAQKPRAVSKLGLLVGGKPPTRTSPLSPSPLRQLSRFYFNFKTVF